MKVAFDLRRLPTNEPATGLLLLGHDVDRLFDLCARLGSDPLPAIYPVLDGFLLKLTVPARASYPGTIRLRSLAGDLFIPADAELIPALHSDEAQGMVRDRGLIFLPGERVLAYAPDEPLSLSKLLTFGQLDRQTWQSLPAPRQWAERIRQIRLELPEPPAEEILEVGGQDIGSEDPRPEDSSLGSKILGKGSMIAGKGMMGLGNLIHSDKLTKLGAKLIQNALSLAPRLSEGLFGRQEAALRWLLHEFREGSVEKALRRALPLLGAGDRGPVVSGGFRLPFHNLLYSLGNILGIRSGVAGIWYGGADIQAELIREYRKAAELAAVNGDCRRAAFIYGKLLRDYRSAANALLQGGLCHDAAILYLTKVGDNLAAARAFAAAGEIDRALELYRQAGQHLLAGDLLRRSGEEEAAIAEYQVAADELVSSHQDYLAAGELMLSRAARADLAGTYFAAGWEMRPGKNDVPCATKLARLLAERAAAAELFGLVSEAEEFLLVPGNDIAAAQFFNEVARLADQPTLAKARGDLRDRSLLALAVKLRQRAAVDARPGNVISDFLGHSTAWDAAVVSDAAYALKAALQRPRTPTGPRLYDGNVSRIQIGQGLVTASCYAPGTGDIFLGFQDGDVYCFRPSRSEVARLPGSISDRVASLTTDAQAHLVVALRDGDPAPTVLTSYLLTPEDEYRVEGRVDLGDANYCLAPLITGISPCHVLGMWNEYRLSFLRGALLAPWGSLENPEEGIDLCSVLLLPVMERPHLAMRVLLFGPNYVRYCERPRRERHHWTAERWWRGNLGWTPCIPEGSSLRSVPIAWLQSEKSHLELVGLTSTGTLHWSLLDIGQAQAAGESQNEIKMLAHNSSVRPEGYRAATLLGPGQVAGVSRSHIDWLRAGSREFAPRSVTKVDLHAAVACYPSYRTRELIVVCSDGAVVRVPIPS